MKKPDILKPKDLYRELSPNIPEDYICTIVHAHFKGRKFYMISQMFTGGEDEELYMLFDEEQTQKLMMKFQTHDPETFMYRLHKRFWNRHGSNVWWKSPVCVTPEAQVPLTLESKFRMTPIKS